MEVVLRALRGTHRASSLPLKSESFAPLASDRPTGALAGLELLATAVILLDGARCVTYANPAAENLFELSRRQLVGHAIDDVFADAANLAAAIGKSPTVNTRSGSRFLCGVRGW